MRLLRKDLVTAFSPTNDQKRVFSRLVSSLRTKFVEGFVSGLIDLSDSLQEKPRGLKAVFTTGEMLYPQQRKLLSDRLNAPVYSYYGSNEIGGIAFECEHSQLHVTDEHILIETLNDAGDPIWEEPGRLVVTDLDNQAMPLIRYEIGDQGVLSQEPCACGRSHTRILQLCGREQDYLENLAEKKLPITYFAGRFRDFSAIGRLQLVQKDKSKIDVLFDGEGAEANAEVQALTQEIQLALGEGIDVSPRRVTKFHVTDRGKIPLIRRLY